MFRYCKDGRCKHKHKLKTAGWHSSFPLQTSISLSPQFLLPRPLLQELQKHITRCAAKLPKHCKQKPVASPRPNFWGAGKFTLASTWEDALLINARPRPFKHAFKALGQRVAAVRALINHARAVHVQRGRGSGDGCAVVQLWLCAPD